MCWKCQSYQWLEVRIDADYQMVGPQLYLESEDPVFQTGLIGKLTLRLVNCR
jgi:hypothetical protein